MSELSGTASGRYVEALCRRLGTVIAGAIVVLVGSVYLAAFHLPLRADFSQLLPQDAPAVRDLRALEARLVAQDTLLVVVDAPASATRAIVAAQLAEEIRALPATLVQRLEDDDTETRAFFREHRHLFVPLEDLELARDSLARRIEHARLAANPLYIDLDEGESTADAEAAEAALDALRQRRAEAEARLERSGLVSDDGRLQLLVIRTGFARTDLTRGTDLVDRLHEIRARILEAPEAAGASIGYTGGVASAVAEHDSLVRGIILSSVITALLVTLVLVLYLRSVRLLLMLTTTLVIGVSAAFGAAALTIGHLNAATAFLGAIIAGNGVNFGIVLLGRYVEERRRHTAAVAMAEAVQGTMRPTIVASLGAAIAYGSLAVTSFKGFSDFALMGAIGMIACWGVTYVVLPPLVVRFGSRVPALRGDPWLGGWLARLFGFRRAGLVCAVMGVLGLAAGAVTCRFVGGDPYEYDIDKLRSAGAAASEVRRWLQISDETFGRGIAGQTFIAADDLAQVEQVVAALRRIDDGVPEPRRTIGTISSVLDVVPPDQAAKLAVLADLRALLDDDALGALEEDERAEIVALRPPDGLVPITPERLPVELQERLRERDGRVGLVIAVRPHERLDEWDGRALIRFAEAVRRLELDDGRAVTTSGPTVIYADIVSAIRADGPVAVSVAAMGVVLMVLFVVGPNARAVAVLVSTGLGCVVLVAACALIGIKVTFLDFVALPLTIGLGVDYAINLAHRQHHQEGRDPIETLRTSGAAVFLCSLSTVIGYGSLLVSDNLGIRGFGLASLIGEISCLVTALVLVPAIVGLGRSQRRDERLA